MRKYLTNKSGEGHIDTALKIIIGVVIGALILGGLYLLFAGDGGVVDQLDTEIVGMMDYTQELRVERAYNEDSGQYYLRYSYDGKHWSEPELPDYGEGATVYALISNNSESDPIEAALIQNGSAYYVLTSEDGGVSWKEHFNFTATSITHFYYGTSAQLPGTAGSFSGERFVIRYKSGNHYTSSSNGHTWAKPTWSDLIPLS